MTPNYLNPPPSPFPVNDQQHELYSTKPHDHAASSSSLPNSHAFTYSSEDHQEGYHQSAVNHLIYQQANNLAPQGGSCDHPMPECESRTPGIKFFLWKKEDGNEQNRGDTQKGSSSAKWMSSKIRLMGKIIKSDRVATEAPTSAAHELKFEDHDRKESTSPLETHDHHNSCYSSTGNINTPIRVCSDCNTTKTPLWRSGPRGPKSLCNACGIRQRKARRAMAAATAAAANGIVVAAHEASVVKSKVQHKEKKSKNSHVAPYKKRFKFAATSDQGIRKKLCFEDLLISLGKNLASQSVFPQDEKEAALLLMALSCGLVHG